MEPRVLVIYPKTYARHGLVERRLLDRATPYAVLIFTQLFEARDPVSYRLGRDGERLTLPDARSGQPIRLDSIRGVWAESLDVPIRLEQPTYDVRNLLQYLKTVGHSETHYFVKSILGLLAHRRLFLPQMMEGMRAHHKLYQLALARDVGFHVPTSYAGSRPAGLMNTLEPESMDELHYRPFSQHRFRARGKQFVTVERFVGEATSYSLHNLNTPALFSKVPRHLRRLRVAAVLDDLWALRIELRDAELDADVTDVAYQRAQDNLLFEPVAVPDDVDRLCRAFLRDAGLRYGIFDLLEDPENGAVWFQVCHPLGRLDLFDEAGLPAVDALIDALVEGLGDG